MAALVQVPGRDCPLCPRLAAFRLANRERWPDWHNAPVPSFGPLDAALLIVGLAPGLRGANRTGRPFTGDGAGELLYPTLLSFGFARGRYGAVPEDGLEMVDCRITNAVRCVPPENRPTPDEAAFCRRFLAAELAAMPRLRAVVALGAVAHAAIIRVLGLRPGAFPFVHGSVHATPRFALADSYHCSRYNTQTGRLTPTAFRAVFADLRGRLGDGAAADQP